MTQLQLLNDYSDIAEISALALGVLFIAQYTLYSPWWKDPVGRTVVAMDIAIFLALVPLVLHTFFHLSFRTREVLSWFDVSCVMCVPVILAWRMVVWHRIADNGSERLFAVIRGVRRRLPLRRNTKHERT